MDQRGRRLLLARCHRGPLGGLQPALLARARLSPDSAAWGAAWRAGSLDSAGFAVSLQAHRAARRQAANAGERYAPYPKAAACSSASAASSGCSCGDDGASHGRRWMTRPPLAAVDAQRSGQPTEVRGRGRFAGQAPGLRGLISDAAPSRPSISRHA